MRQLAVVFVLLAVAVAIATAIAVVHSSFGASPAYVVNVDKRLAERDAGELLAAVLLVAAFVLSRLDRRP